MKSFVVLSYLILYLNCFYTNSLAQGNESGTQEHAGVSNDKTKFSDWCESSVPEDQELVTRSFDLYNLIFEPGDLPSNEVELQKIALASTNLLLKLPLMEDVNNILFDSAWHIAHSTETSEKLSGEDLQARPEKAMLKKIESMILSDVSLAKSYIEELQKAANMLAEITEENPDFSLTMRQIILQQSSKTCFENEMNAKYTKHRIGFGFFVERETTIEEKCESFQRHLLAQAILQLAKTSKADQVQKLLDEVIEITDEKLRYIADISSTSVFYPILGEHFKKNPDLDGEVTKIRDELVKKYKIEFLCEQYSKLIISDIL